MFVFDRAALLLPADSPRNFPNKTSTCAVAYFEYSRRQLVDEVAVVRNEHHGPGVLRSSASSKTSLARMSRWLVGSSSSRKFAGCSSMRSQGIAVALAAGEHADALENIVGGKQKASQQAAQLGLRRARREPRRDHRGCAHQDRVPCTDPARNSPPARCGPSLYSPAVSGSVPDKQFDQSGFTGAIYSDQRNAIAALDR